MTFPVQICSNGISDAFKPPRWPAEIFVAPGFDFVCVSATVGVPGERANVDGAAGSMSDRLAAADHARDGASATAKTRYLGIYIT